MTIWPKSSFVAKFGNQWCHMTCDGNLDELHALAEKIGLKRQWYQPKSTPHYDLTPTYREKALAAGAVYKSAREQAKDRIAAREAARSLTAGKDISD